MVTKTFKIESTGRSYGYAASNMADKLGYPHIVRSVDGLVSVSMCESAWKYVKKLLENY